KKFALPLLGMLQSRAGAPEAIANVFIELRDDEKREWADMILEFDEPFRSQLAERCAFAEIHFRAASDTFVASLFPFVDLGKIAQRRIPPSPTLVLSPMARVAELSREASISDDWMQVQSLLLERKEFFIGDLRQLRMAINFFKDSRNYYMLDWLERNGFPLDNIVKLDEQYQFYVACLHADESELNAAFATSGKKVTYFADVQQLWPSRSNRLDSAPETATEPAPYKATALEFLIQSNHRPIARLLLEKGEYQIALPSWDIVERTKSDPELSVIYSKMLRLNPKRNNLSGAQQRAATEVDRTFLETIYGPQFDMKAIEANEDHLEIFDRSADEFLLKAIEDDNNALLDFAFRRLKDDFRVGKLPLTANRRGKPILFDVLMDNPDQLFEMAKNKPHFLNRLLAEGLYPSHDFEPGPDSLENNSISRALQHAKMVREEYGTRQNR
ncbi:MAG: hypothetical protein KDB22_28135, partial [Planctomycetales bacterium]|nr:hypothetical protein [Planctomycetales bacterium]